MVNNIDKYIKELERKSQLGIEPSLHCATTNNMHSGASIALGNRSAPKGIGEELFSLSLPDVAAFIF